GTVIRQGTIKELTQQRGTFVIGLDGVEEFPAAEVRALGFSANPGHGPHWEVVLSDGQTIDPVLAVLHEKGLHLRHLIEKRQSLEELFVATVEGAEPGTDRRRVPPPPPPGPQLVSKGAQQ